MTLIDVLSGQKAIKHALRIVAGDYVIPDEMPALERALEQLLETFEKELAHYTPDEIEAVSGTVTP